MAELQLKIEEAEETNDPAAEARASRKLLDLIRRVSIFDIPTADQNRLSKVAKDSSILSSCTFA